MKEVICKMRITQFIKSDNYEIEVTDHPNTDPAVSESFACITFSHKRNQYCIHMKSLKAIEVLLANAMLEVVAVQGAILEAEK